MGEGGGGDVKKRFVFNVACLLSRWVKERSVCCIYQSCQQ